MLSKPKFKRWLLPLLLLSAILVCQSASSASLFSTFFKTFNVVNSTCTSNFDVSRKKAKELTEGTVTNEKKNSKDEKYIEKLHDDFKKPLDNVNLSDFVDFTKEDIAHIVIGTLEEKKIKDRMCGAHTNWAITNTLHKAENYVLRYPPREPELFDNGVKIHTIDYWIEETNEKGETIKDEDGESVKIVRQFNKAQFPDSWDDEYILNAVKKVIVNYLANETHKEQKNRRKHERKSKPYPIFGEVDEVKIAVIIEPTNSDGQVSRKILSAYPDYELPTQSFTHQIRRFP